MKKYLGIELGSTRIKAVLIDERGRVLASGSHDWENRLTDGFWSYGMDEVETGLQDAYRKLAEEYRATSGEALTVLDGMGVSAMMHGYLPFDRDGTQLVPFRTWRNTTTEQAAALLTERFGFNIPQRWSVAHLYQAILNRESHVERLAHFTTLAGYVHGLLCGERVLGVGDASGMFPIDSALADYDAALLKSFQELTGIDLRALLPRVLRAGEAAGTLTEAGARLLDPDGMLRPGVPLCPPEGDAGTGMVATNSIRPRCGNVSAGTSIFAMLVLEQALTRVYTEIDMVTTPNGLPVAMVHCNSCTSDLDAWVKLFGEAAALMGAQYTKPALYDALYETVLEGEADGGGLLSYNYYAGEPITGFSDGRPLFVRKPDSHLTLGNFMRVKLYSALATLRLGLDILFSEGVGLDRLLGHGGLFKTPVIGQRMMAAAAGVPVSVMETAGEGGAWGIALLAAYWEQARIGVRLEDYLDKIFEAQGGSTLAPDPQDTAGFAAFLEQYRKGLPIARAAVDYY